MMHDAAVSGRVLLRRKCTQLSGARETSEGLVHWLHVRTSYGESQSQFARPVKKSKIKSQLSTVQSDSCLASSLSASIPHFLCLMTPSPTSGNLPSMKQQQVL